MQLKTRSWGAPDDEAVICIHGVTQHGGIFSDLGRRLASRGNFVVAVDLRGHGESDREPPWNTETHVEDVLQILDTLGVQRVTWIGHSFGGLVAAALAVETGERTRRLALLEPAMEIPADRALRSAEIDRLDWSFATVDGAVNALLSNNLIVSTPRSVVDSFVRDDVRQGADGRFRFRFCPSAVVVAWSEMVRTAPRIAQCPTLFVCAEATGLDGSAHKARYRETLHDSLTWANVPNGHNVLWESPTETIEAVERFLA